MSIDRRCILKGITLGGIVGIAAGTPFHTVLAKAQPVISDRAFPDQKLIVLTNKGPIEQTFLQGARAAGGPGLDVRNLTHDLGAVLDFEHWIRHQPDMHIIGLLDDASASLIVDMARSTGAQMQWLGQHSIQGELTRHHLITTDISRDCPRYLGRQLHACGAGFSLSEERQGAAGAPRQLAGPLRKTNQSGAWAGSIGYLLASLGTYPAAPAPMTPAVSISSTGSFVSFSIKVSNRA